VAVFLSSVPLLLALAPWAAQGSDGAQPDVARPVFRIDGEPVAVGAYEDWLLEVLGEPEAHDYALVRLVEQEGKRIGVQVGEGEVRDALDQEIQVRVDNAFKGRREGWVAELERTGRSEGEYRRARSLELGSWMLARRIAAVGRVVPEDKIEREWELQYGRKGLRYDLRLIYFQVVMEMPPEGTPNAARMLQNEARKQRRFGDAQDARRRIEAGEDFAAVAREVSEDEATRENGGSPPGGFQYWRWPASFNDALERLQPGELSEPVYAKGGWWLVQVLEVDQTPLADVRDGIVAELLERGPESDEVAAVQTRLMKDARIEILPAMYAVHGPERWPDPDEVVMRVNDIAVRRGEYATWLMHTQGSSLSTRYIEDWLVARKADEEGVTVDDDEVRQRVLRLVQMRIDNEHHGSREAFLAYLDASQMTEDAFARRFEWRSRSDLLVEKLIKKARTITPEMLHQRWEDLYGADGRGRDVRSLAIAIERPDLPPGLTPQELQNRLGAAAEAAHARATDVVRRLRDGEDFASVAQQTGDPAPPEGIDAAPGRFRPQLWPPDVAAAVGVLPPGSVSEPLRSGPYWFVFECVALRDVPFDDVRDELETQLLNEQPASIQVATYRNVLYKQADVAVLPSLYE
jgi:parvulin-like peptidyl-prolyl isomerase